MTFYTDGVVPWNSLDNNTRGPLASELQAGYPCGEADQQLFNWAAGWPIGNIWNVLLQCGFTPDTDKLLDLARAIQSGKMNYAVATGTANAWVVAPALAVPAYSSGRVLFIIAPATNTSTTVNMNVSGLGNRRIKKADGNDPQPGDLQIGVAYPTMDDGTFIRVLGPLPSDRLAQKYLGFHGDPVSQDIAPSTASLISAYTGVVNNLPGSSQAAGIITIGTSGYYNVTANLLNLMPTVSSGSYSYTISVSKVDAGGTALVSIAALPVLVTTASMNTLAGSSAGVVKLTAGEKLAAFMRHNLPATNIPVSVSLDIQFLGA